MCVCCVSACVSVQCYQSVNNRCKTVQLARLSSATVLATCKYKLIYMTTSDMFSSPPPLTECLYFKNAMYLALSFQMFAFVNISLSPFVAELYSWYG